eukprot:4503749-Prymnesium_polylepis.1
MRSAFVASPSPGAGPPPLPAVTAPADPDSPPPEARAPPVATVREVDTSAAPRAAGCAAAAPSPGP